MNFEEWWDDSKGNEDLKQEVTNLLQSSNYDDEFISEEEKALWHYSEEELLKIKANLLMNQTDRIDAGLRYAQADIKRKLKNI